ncbi:unnamed protein product [Schistosoma curassoni]|uniref:Uncharacterized protein n=1 Tax=Schistosoma curassoni TaxID=6186 RepID=A0A183KM13_9TREM|nr:unnamed protein product [Schistosoma curassoni]
MKNISLFKICLFQLILFYWNQIISLFYHH